MTTAEQVLDTAVQLLADPRSWHQGGWASDDGTAFCALGALREARRRLGIALGHEHHHEMQTPAGVALQAIIRERYPAFTNGRLYPNEFIYEGWNDLVSIGSWNDARDREHAEVLEAFEKARAYAAEKGL